MLETWNHHLVSGSRNTTQTGSHTQVRDHKWVLDLSLDDDDGGCNRSTEHLAVGNFAIDRAIGARRAWYSSPSNSSRVKPPTSQDRKKPTMRVKGQGNPHQDHLAKAIWLQSARQPWSHASATDTLAKKDWQWRMILGFQCLILGIDWGFAISRAVLLLRLLFLLVCNSLQLFSGRRLGKTKQKNWVRKYLGISFLSMVSILKLLVSIGCGDVSGGGWAVPAEEVLRPPPQLHSQNVLCDSPA